MSQLSSIRDSLSRIKHPAFRQYALQALEKAMDDDDWHDLDYALNLKRWPEPIEDFLMDKRHMDASQLIYPKVVEELIKMNTGDYVEALLTGGIGSGKTTAALYTNAYQLYLVSCLINPHQQYGLDPASEILFLFQNATDTLAKTVDYARFKAMLERAPYFQNHYLWRQDLESKLQFPNRVEVVPLGGSASKALGQNVMGGLIDELNYMVRIDSSKQALDGGVFDQAVTMYNSISRRRKSRFMKMGKLPGILCLVSSRRYPGEFTDVKEKEAETDPTIYVYDKRVWEVKPEGTFSGEMFKVFVGADDQNAEICQDGVEYDEALVIEVPVEYQTEFEEDLLDALREIAGVAKASKALFFRNVEALTESFGWLDNVFQPDEVDFDRIELELIPEALIAPEGLYGAHIDLAISGDSAGIAIGRISEFKPDKFMDKGEEMQPVFEVVGTLRVMPPKDGQIIISKIRKILYTLTALGMDLRWVSFDSFQSYDSLQILRGKGYTAGLVSVDQTPVPYHLFRQAVNAGRMQLPYNDFLYEECKALLEDREKGKIDHPPKGSKDVADAVAGLCYLLYTRREIWVNMGYTPSTLPNAGSVQEALAKKQKQAMEELQKLETAT